ncbi:MAG TPA: hypothetical protein VN843_25410, partial [Anaerolineales bacterium]|nr:hypothetical protein [Anaerolineales bacterium]
MLLPKAQHIGFEGSARGQACASQGWNRSHRLSQGRNFRVSVFRCTTNAEDQSSVRVVVIKDDLITNKPNFLPYRITFSGVASNESKFNPLPTALLRV